MMFLAGAQISISHAVTLAPDDIVNWSVISSMADCQYIASSVEVVPKVGFYYMLDGQSCQSCGREFVLWIYFL